MAELKTKATAADPEAFFESIDERRRPDCRRIAELMSRVTGAPAKMWGASIVGFGEYRYKYESGRENDWFLTGFSPRKQDLTLYLSSGFESHDELLLRLGKFKTGKSCLYIKKLSDIDESVLEALLTAAVDRLKK